MEFVFDGLKLTGEALLRMALNPFYYIGLIGVALLYRRQTLLERKLFFVRLHRMAGQFFRSLGWGTLLGLFLSFVSAGFGLMLSFDALLWVWGVTLVLLLVRVRFASFVYAAIVLGLLQLVIERIPQLQDVQGLSPVITSLLDIHLPSLFALAAVVLLAEAVLIRITGKKDATPLYLEGKRGKVVGAYELQGLWVMPLFLVVPAGFGGNVEMASLLWPMFFGGDAWQAGWSLLAFPVIVGYSAITASTYPERKAKRAAGWLVLCAVVAGAASVCAELWPLAAIGAVVATLVLREGWSLYSDRREQSQSPVFVHERRGLKVLDVMSGSPAAEMGIVRGETVVKANGVPVSTKEELHAALRTNSAFCKLEIVNLEGHNRFEHRALYDGEHHGLGLVLCPDDSVQHAEKWRPLTLLSLLRPIRRGKASLVSPPTIVEADNPTASSPSIEA